MLNEIQRYLQAEIQGGTSEGYMHIFDTMIEEGFITQEYYSANEIEIMHMFDEHYFECECCSWLFPDSEQSDSDGLICTSCYDY